MSFDGQVPSRAIRYHLLAPDHKHIVGDEWIRQGKTGTLVYRNQKDNPMVDLKGFVPPAR